MKKTTFFLIVAMMLCCVSCNFDSKRNSKTIFGLTIGQKYSKQQISNAMEKYASCEYSIINGKTVKRGALTEYHYSDFFVGNAISFGGVDWNELCFHVDKSNRLCQVDFSKTVEKNEVKIYQELAFAFEEQYGSPQKDEENMKVWDMEKYSILISVCNSDTSTSRNDSQFERMFQEVLDSVIGSIIGEDSREYLESSAQTVRLSYYNKDLLIEAKRQTRSELF